MIDRNNFFDGCKTIEEGKKLYRELLKKHHPDKGGDVEVAQKLNNDYEAFCLLVINNAFKEDDRSEGKDSGPFASVLNRMSRLNIRIEIIGHWIYAFESYEVREELKALGLWFSRSHKAWVFSGGKKRRMRGRYTTKELRNKWGSKKVQEERELHKVG